MGNYTNSGNKSVKFVNNVDKDGNTYEQKGDFNKLEKSFTYPNGDRYTVNNMNKY